tara:strand:- start:5601 stop:6263 length:663 start_codon:yes stop_codon:yes gene_type:complete
MKNLAFILLLTILGISSAQAQFGQQPEREDRFSNTLGLDPKNAIWGGKKDSQGNRRNPPGLVFKGGAAINMDYWEPKAFINIFQHIHYYGIGLSLHREILTVPLTYGRGNTQSTLAVLMGVEVQFVARYGLDHEGTVFQGLYEKDTSYNPEFLNPAISTKIRWDRPFEWPGYIEGEGTYTQRYDIKKYWGPESDWQMFKNPGFYLTIGFYFTEIIELLNN